MRTRTAIARAASACECVPIQSGQPSTAPQPYHDSLAEVQVAMTIALASARNSFQEVVDTSGRDITCLLKGLSTSSGLGRFLEAWAVVQCGIIATMLSQLIARNDVLAAPAKEIIRSVGELIH
jgi:hypothetical protein